MRKIGSKFLIFLSCLTICLTIFSSESEAETLEPTYEVYEYTAEDLAEEEYWDSLEYLAQCVEAEAGNQGYLGKVYVADCILNLYDAGDYNNFYELINKKGMFSVVSNGSIDCIPSEETYEIVASELENRTNSEIMYFRTKKFHSFGTPCFKYKDHYFSK